MKSSPDMNKVWSEIKAKLEGQLEGQPETPPIKEVKVCFRKMFSSRVFPQLEVGNNVETEFKTKGKVVEVKKEEHLDGKVYAVQEEETGETNLYHETAIKEKTEQKPLTSTQSSEQVKEGVPNGFYSNEYLLTINSWIPPRDEGKYPATAPCWKEDCDKPLTVCGYPHYICENKHYYNAETGEKWLWKGYDEVYHGLLGILQGHVEPTYQKLFYPTSRATTHTEADKISTQLCQIGNILYGKLNIQEEDKYHWGKDNLRDFAGIRFAINMMNQAMLAKCRIKFPDESEFGKSFDGFDEYDEYDANEYLKIYGEQHIREMLLSIEKAKAEMPKPTVQKTLF